MKKDNPVQNLSSVKNHIYSLPSTYGELARSCTLMQCTVCVLDYMLLLPKLGKDLLVNINDK
jgi:hypothetical protein